MSQLPEMPAAAGWSEQDYDPSAFGRQQEAPPVAGAAPQQAVSASQYGQQHAGWQQDTEPDWGASQQGYDVAGQPGYAAQPGYVSGQQPEPAMAAQDAESGLPTEFDHLFRDSTPDQRRAIDRQKPVVGGAAPGYLNSAQSADAAMPEAPAAGPDQSAAQGLPGGGYQQFPQQQGFPQPADQYQGSPFGAAQYDSGQYPAGQFPNGQYQGAQFQGGQYGQEPIGYGGQGGYGGDGYDGAGGGPRNRRGLIIGAAVAVVAVVGIVVAVSSSGSPGKPQAGPGTPAPSASKASPKQQADQIYQLIQQSGQLRSDANTGVIDVNGCKDLANAQSLLSSTAQKRQAQADSVAKIDVSGIQNGAELVNQLKAAWSASALYDSTYAQIAGDLQGGCKSGAAKKDPNYKTTSEQATAADNAKAQAAQLWNDNVATPLGESSITEGRL